jgi:hypothetical protein
MSNLREINIRRAINYIKFNNKIENPVKMNMTENGKYLLLAHGRTIEPYNFKVPKNINFITITKVSSNCMLDYSIDKEIQDFYKAGHTIFQNNDLSVNLTENGEKLMQKLNQRYDREVYYFKNHLQNTTANEMFLDFNRDSRTEGSVKSIGIIDLLGKNDSIKNVIDLYISKNKNTNNKNKKYKIKQILLSTLLSMYSDNIINKNKKKTFIICACRGFSGNNNSNKLLARTVSGTQAEKTPRSQNNSVSSSNY